MTGFRASRQGYWGLDGAVEGWTPDLMTFGKVMGGGFPAAAFGGRADVMAMLSPEGPVYQAGTLSGNPVATTAGLATLRLADDGVYEHLTKVGDAIKAAAADALADAGVPHVVQSAGTMFSVFFTGAQVRDFAQASTQDTAAFAAFFHAMLEAGRLPAALGVRGVVPVRRPRRRRGGDRPRGPARCGPRRRARHRGDRMTQETIVHLLRHGEVHNPGGVLYGRLPGFHLSDLGNRMAERVAETIGDRDIVHLRVSPLERVRETAAPLAAARGLEPVVDERVIESSNVFEGKRFGEGRQHAVQPRRRGCTCTTRSGRRGASRTGRSRRGCARPSRTPARRPPGHEAVVVSHQLPIWVARLSAEGRPFLHDPRKRQCTLCSLTSLHFEDARLVRVTYSEPAGDMIPLADKRAPFSAGGRARGEQALIRPPLACSVRSPACSLLDRLLEPEGTGDKGFITSDGQVRQVGAADRGEPDRPRRRGPRRRRRWLSPTCAASPWSSSSGGRGARRAGTRRPTSWPPRRELGDRASFVGINIRDVDRPTPRRSSARFGVPYPSFYSPDGEALLPFSGTLTAELDPQLRRPRRRGPGGRQHHRPAPVDDDAGRARRGRTAAERDRSWLTGSPTQAGSGSLLARRPRGARRRPGVVLLPVRHPAAARLPRPTPPG